MIWRDLREPRARLLLLGDLLALLLFVVMGRSSHDEGNPVPGILGTAWPFIVAWLTVAPVMGAFRQHPGAGVAAVARVTVISWLTALPVAALLRAIALGRVSPWTFYLVTLIVAGVLLLVWRSVVAYVERRRVARPAG